MQSSYILEDRNTPLNPKHANLNDSLQTQYLDVDEQDNSFLANATRTISRFVGSICTPKQVLGLLRVLKAVTLVFLVLTCLADIMYMIFVEFMSSKEVKMLAGGNRDRILRLYGLGLALIGLAIELDFSRVIKKMAGLKGFLPRAFFYFFIAQITGSHPILLVDWASAASNAAAAEQNYNDDAAGDDYNNNNNGDDDAAAADDAYEAAADDYYSSAASAVSETLAIPNSAVGFQRVTSFVLYVHTSTAWYYRSLM